MNRRNFIQSAVAGAVSVGFISLPNTPSSFTIKVYGVWDGKYAPVSDAMVYVFDEATQHQMFLGRTSDKGEAKVYPGSRDGKTALVRIRKATDKIYYKPFEAYTQISNGEAMVVTLEQDI